MTNGNLTLAAGQYQFGGLGLVSSNLTVTGQVIVYLSGYDTVINGSSINWTTPTSPGNFQVYVPSSNDNSSPAFEVGTSQAAMVVAGKKLHYHIRDGATIIGSLMGYTYDMSGTSVLHYPSNPLANTTIQGNVVLTQIGQKSDSGSQTTFNATNCFIATAAYGDTAGLVFHLRGFCIRHRYLSRY